MKKHQTEFWAIKELLFVALNVYIFDYCEMYIIEKKDISRRDRWMMEEADFIDCRLKIRSACEVRLAAVDSNRIVLDSRAWNSSSVRSIPRDTVLSVLEPIDNVRGSVLYTDEWDRPFVSMSSADERG